MATRGTYKVDGTLLYNHWDNYPSGAACHFIDVIKKCHNLELFSVIRGMEEVKKTGSIFDGRAEFHYEIDNNSKKITCYSIPFDVDKLIIHSCGSFVNWINDNVKNSLEESDNIEDFQIVELYNNYFMTLSQCREMITQKHKRAIELTEKGHHGNATSEWSEVLEIINKSGLNFNDIKNEYLTKYSPHFAKVYNHDNTKHFDTYAYANN